MSIQPDEEMVNARGYEPRDANFKRLILIGFGLLGLVVGMMLLVIAVQAVFLKTVSEPPGPSSSLAEQHPMPPEPRLQATPHIDMKTFWAREDSLLNSYGWVDSQAGIVRIPIDRAMDIVLEKGFPVSRSAETTNVATRRRSGDQ